MTARKTLDWMEVDPDDKTTYPKPMPASSSSGAARCTPFSTECMTASAQCDRSFAERRGVSSSSAR